jgi:hypothetical protein
VTAGDLIVVVAAILLSLGFTALVVTLMRVLDTVRDLRTEVSDLRVETTALIDEMIVTTHEARVTMDEARTDLERFDKVLGSAEAIGDAVSRRVARTAFSSPAIKAAGVARGTSRAVSRLRGRPKVRTVDPSPRREVLDLDAPRDTRRRRKRRRGA